MLSQNESMGLGKPRPPGVESGEGFQGRKVKEHLEKQDIRVHGTQWDALTGAGHS